MSCLHRNAVQDIFQSRAAPPLSRIIVPPQCAYKTEETFNSVELYHHFILHRLNSIHQNLYFTLILCVCIYTGCGVPECRHVSHTHVWRSEDILRRWLSPSTKWFRGQTQVVRFARVPLSMDPSRQPHPIVLALSECSMPWHHMQGKQLNPWKCQHCAKALDFFFLD